MHPGGIPMCGMHLALWIRELSTQYDASVALRAAPAAPFLQPGNINGLTQVLVSAKLTPEARASIETDVVNMGPVDVRELTHADWCALPSWSSLREMERRRILAQ
eukprot:9634833-Karenia_brevis.AAC.1